MFLVRYTGLGSAGWALWVMTSDAVSTQERSETSGQQLSPEQVAAAAMVAQAREQGLELTGPDGLLKLLNEEMTEHLGHEPNRVDSAGIGQYP